MIRTRDDRRQKKQIRDPGATKALPHSEECERAVLAAVLLSPHLLPIVTARLSSEDFYLERHQAIWECMLEIQERGDEIDIRALQGRLEICGKFELVGGLAYLAGLDLDLPDLGRIESYVEIVKERSIRRQLIQTAQRITFDAFESGDEAEMILCEAESEIRQLRGESRPAAGRSRAEVFDEIMIRIEAAEDGAVGIGTSIESFDLRTNGLGAELVTIGGGTGVGKSILGRQVAEHVASAHGPVQYWSGEMDDVSLEMRGLSAGSGVEHWKLRSGRVSADEMLRVSGYISATGEIPLEIIDKPGFSVDDVESVAINAARSAGGLRAVFIDYLTLMGQPGGQWRSKREEVGETTRRLKQLTRELEIPVILMAQLNRESAGKAPWEPEVHHLAESAAIERDSDLVMLMYPRLLDPDLEDYAEWKSRNPRETWLKVAKHRNGDDGYRIAMELQKPLVRFAVSYDENTETAW